MIERRTAPAPPAGADPGDGRTGKRPAFGRADEEPYRRRASDGIRLALGLVGFGLVASRAQHVSTLDRTVFELFNSLPTALEPAFRLLWSLGALWALGLVGAAAIGARRWRLARDLFLSGLAAWAVARVFGSVVIDRSGFRAGLRILTRVATTPSFPLVRLALLVAVVATAGPYVGRPTRRAGQTLAVGVGLSALYLGAAYPKDIVGAALLGWGLAATVHLVFGSPGGRPTTAQLDLALDQLGIRVEELHLAVEQPPDATVFHGRRNGGGVRIKVIGRDQVEAQLLAKAWRFAVFKDSAPTLYLSRLNQVEHEACMTLLARAAGCRVPNVVFAGKAGLDAALLVEERVPGPRLADLAPADVTDELLRAIWREVASLHRAHIAHGTLHAAHIVIAEDGPAIVDFATASTAGFTHRRSADVAELLTTTAAFVGSPRALDACKQVLGDEALDDALPWLQPAALSRATRTGGGASRRAVQARLEALRDEAALVTGGPTPDLEQLHRVSTSSLLLAVGAFVAVGVLLGQVGHPSEVWTTIRHARWGWVAVGLALSMATNLPYAVALMGCVPMRLPLWPTTELQVAMSYSNLAVPAVGGLALQVRFLQRQGADLASAVAAGGLLNTFGNVVSQLGLFGVAVWLSPESFHLSDLPVTGIAETMLGLLLLAGVGTGLVVGVPRLRRAVMPPARHAATTLAGALRSGRHLILLVGGNVVTSTLYALCLQCSLEAFGGSLSFWTALGLNIAVSTMAALVPVPGGATALGSVGLSGALTAFGVPARVAVPAVLTNQILVSYLPAIPGWFATRHLLHRAEL